MPPDARLMTSDEELSHAQALGMIMAGTVAAGDNDFLEAFPITSMQGVIPCKTFYVVGVDHKGVVYHASVHATEQSAWDMMDAIAQALANC